MGWRYIKSLISRQSWVSKIVYTVTTRKLWNRKSTFSYEVICHVITTNALYYCFNVVFILHIFLLSLYIYSLRFLILQSLLFQQRLGKGEDRIFEYWVAGRLFLAPHPRECYVCYHDSAPQVHHFSIKGTVDGVSSLPPWHVRFTTILFKPSVRSKQQWERLRHFFNL